MPLKKQKGVESDEEGMEEDQSVTITLGKDELSAINLLRTENETIVQVLRRALQDSLEYGVMKHVLSSIDGRIADLSKKYKISQSSIINFRYNVEEGMRVPEELRKKEDSMTKIMNLKASLEKKWAEVEKTEE
ncbi:MAG: hypothetical protein M1476_06430 [Candidatus Thermoplasmatota archaeon]|nr:hypothetical protein [Candidatus Thermoplasmatota archaeon]